MTGFFVMRGNGADAITGERVVKNQRVFDTGVKNRRTAFLGATKTRVIKEETIVWLAKEAGLKICGDNCDCKSDERVSEPAQVVEREDASVGGGKSPAGTVKAGGSKTPKRRSSGTTKSK